MLYKQQDERQPTVAHRLTYAGALLRAGQVGEAKTIYDQLMRKAGTNVPVAAPAASVTVCAASLMRNGAAELAIEYLRPAFQPASPDPTIGLFLARAQCAAGDLKRARAVLKQLDNKNPAEWETGLRVEFARLEILTGDVRRGRELLDHVDHSVEQMYRDSILANLTLRDRDWAKASQTLAEAEAKVPKEINEKNIPQPWRNTQREIRSVQLRRAICLWKEGKRDAAFGEMITAQMTDEEYVRSAALVLQVANDLVEQNQSNALSNLNALAGHDSRLADSIRPLETALRSRTAAAPAVAKLKETLAKFDHTSDWTTTLLFEILSAAIPSAKVSAAAD